MVWHPGFIRTGLVKFLGISLAIGDVVVLMSLPTLSVFPWTPAMFQFNVPTLDDDFLIGRVSLVVSSRFPRPSVVQHREGMWQTQYEPNGHLLMFVWLFMSLMSCSLSVCLWSFGLCFYMCLWMCVFVCCLCFLHPALGLTSDREDQAVTGGRVLLAP